jgi:hypothetical protein
MVVLRYWEGSLYHPAFMSMSGGKAVSAMILQSDKDKVQLKDDAGIRSGSLYFVLVEWDVAYHMSTM